MEASILMWNLLKAVGFIALYLCIGLFASFVCVGAGSVHITFVADLVMVLAGLLYCVWRVFPEDRSYRERSVFMGFGRFLGQFFELGAIWLLAQMTASIVQTRFYDAGYASYQQSIADSNVLEMLFLTVVLAPVMEEVLMRGMVQSCIRERFGPVAGVLIASIVFAVLHGTLIHLYVGFVLGIAFGLIYERTRFLPACIFAHILCNFMSFALSGVEFSDASGYVIAAVLLNVWMAVRFFRALSGMRYDYYALKLMSRNDFDELCFGDREQDG